MEAHVDIWKIETMIDIQYEMKYTYACRIQEHAETSKHRGTNQQTETVTITITKHA